jgi:hypothetical protein
MKSGELSPTCSQTQVGQRPIEKQMTAAQKIMKKRRAALRELAK